MITFHNRIKEVEEVCKSADHNPLLNVYGEAGIGKTSLLRESARQLRNNSPPSIVIFCDLTSLAESESPHEALLRELVKQSEGRLSGIQREPELVAGQIVGQLTVLAAHQSAYLMFDNTEALQEDRGFWEWMHINLVEPLVVEGSVKQIFAGRIPVPWRRFELRRAVKLLQLGPIDPQDEAKSLIKENLKNANLDVEGQDLSQATELALKFTFGHPGLSEEVATYTADHWPIESLAAFSQKLCAEKIEPFINETLFGDVEPPWKDILWWASVLDWFDPTILQRYLTHIAPDLVQGQADYFFIQGITRLRTRNTVVWREERGDRLHGVIHNIVRQCLKTLAPKKYIRACEAAAQTFREIGDEFPEGEEAKQDFYNEAQTYEKRAKVMEETA